MSRSSVRSRECRRIPRAVAMKRVLGAEWLEPRLLLSITTPVSATANAYVEQATPYGNYGGSSNLLVENLPANQYDSCLKFNFNPGAFSGQLLSSGH